MGRSIYRFYGVEQERRLYDGWIQKGDKRVDCRNIIIWIGSYWDEEVAGIRWAWRKRWTE